MNVILINKLTSVLSIQEVKLTLLDYLVSHLFLNIFSITTMDHPRSPSSGNHLVINTTEELIMIFTTHTLTVSIK